MDLNWDKYEIEVRNDDAIKRSQTIFDFVQRTFNRLDGLYLRNFFLLIDNTLRDQLSKQSAAITKKLNKEKNPETKERKVHLCLLQKSLFCE